MWMGQVCLYRVEQACGGSGLSSLEMSREWHVQRPWGRKVLYPQGAGEGLPGSECTGKVRVLDGSSQAPRGPREVPLSISLRGAIFSLGV